MRNIIFFDDNEVRKALLPLTFTRPAAELRVGITTIATALSEDPGTVEEVYEPFLIKEGFINRTPRGREVTDLAYTHLKRQRQSKTMSLF